MSGFEVGELIVSCKPYAHVLFDRYKGQYCDFCMKKNNGLKKCSQCEFSYFCDRNCQRKAWEMHKLECKFLKNFGNEKPDCMTRLIALILLKVKKNGPNEPFEEVHGRKVSIESLISHTDDIKKNPVEYPLVKKYLSNLKAYIGYDDLAYVTEIFGKIVVNAFEISCDTGKIGWGLYLGASVFDHSCEPNAVWVFDGTTLYVRMRKSYPHRDISKVYLSYIADMLLTEERQKKLWEKYYFHCKCNLCTSPCSDIQMTRLLNDSDETINKALKCKEEFLKKEQLLEKMLEVNPKLVYKECQKLLESQSEVFADTNIYKVRTQHLALKACIRLGALKDGLPLLSSLEEPVKLYLGTNHPHLAYFLVDYGTCLLTSGNRSLAASKLSEAEAIVKVVYGEQHPCYRELKLFSQFSLIE